MLAGMEFAYDSAICVNHYYKKFSEVIISDYNHNKPLPCMPSVRKYVKMQFLSDIETGNGRSDFD